MDHATILRAIAMQTPDFEDAVQMSAATTIQADFIITRNEADFSSSSIPIYTPESFLNYWEANS